MATAAATTNAERPNIVVILTDDQGYGELSCHGNPALRTPHLDRLHDESARLTDFHVAPMCTPTRGQLLSGVDALRNQACNVSSGRTLLRRDLPTMAGLFADAGYATGLFGKWHLGDNHPYRPQDRGFEESVWYPSSHIGSAPDFWDNDYFDDVYCHDGQRRPFKGYTTDVFFAEAIRWIGERRRANRPFLCLIPTAAPHGPLFVPARYREAMEPIVARLQLPETNPADRNALVRYLAMLANLDENVGRLEAFLREAGLRENTIVVFLTDNGSTFGPGYFNAGMRGGKRTLWEGGHRVPCFIRWPAGDVQPRDVSALTQVQDLLPTLLDLAGVPVPAGVGFDGTTLEALLRGKQPPVASADRDRLLRALDERMLVVQFTGTEHPVPRRGDACVMWRRWRLLQDRELYDLSSDPEQKRDVAADHPDVVARLRAHYARWWDGVAPQIDVVQRPIIGHDAEPQSLLSPCEWRDVFFDQGEQVRRGDRRSGVWHLEAARAGTYEFELRRWPKECGAAIAEGLPAVPLTDGE
ncbi:MAG: arylsulfatase, partial [Planctomycetia bacterium]|nr:arylsulfatase [Planctomycetia bacterium]